MQPTLTKSAPNSHSSVYLSNYIVLAICSQSAIVAYMIGVRCYTSYCT